MPQKQNQRQFPSYFKTLADQALIRQALQSSPFFAALDDDQMDRFVDSAKLKTFQPGEIVILEGCVDGDDDDEEEEEDSNHYNDNVESGKVGGRPHSSVQLPPITLEADETIGSIEQQIPTSRGDENESKLQDSDGESSLEEESSERTIDKEESDDTDKTLDEGESDYESLTIIGNDDQNDSSDEVLHGERTDDHENYENEKVTERKADELEGAATENYEDDDPDVPIKKTSTGIEIPRSSMQNALANTQVRQRTDWIRKNDRSIPPPARSGVERSIYIVRRGNAAVWYRPAFSPASLGPGTLFGEGGFLFGRQHSASVVASKKKSGDALECWVLDIGTFRRHVLPSPRMTSVFEQFASMKDEENGEQYMTMQDFVAACELDDSFRLQTAQDPLLSSRIAMTYNLLQTKQSKSSPHAKIFLEDFCLLHLLLSRPDPEVDIAFLLMDRKKCGLVSLDDLAFFVGPDIDLQTQFFQRYFGKDGSHSIRQIHFSQFLDDLQREMGKQAFLRAVETYGNDEGFLNSKVFVNVVTTACGLRLPLSVESRIEEIYCTAEFNENNSSADENGMTNNRSELYVAYGDFLAIQEVLRNLSGICSLIDRAQEVKGGPISTEDFKIANGVLGLAGHLNRLQVELVFKLFDMDQDGYITRDDAATVCGVNFAQKLMVVDKRGGRLTIAPPDSLLDKQMTKATQNEHEDLKRLRFIHYMQYFGVAVVASALSSMLLYPLDLVKTRLMNQRPNPKMYLGLTDCFYQAWRVEGFRGIYRGLAPQLIGVAPEKAIKLQVNDLLRLAFSKSDESTGESSIDLKLEFAAGAIAGACQLLVANPMEIIKIRMQLQGETARLLREQGYTPSSPQSLRGVVRDLGFPGVYRGASACLLRDIPFNALYFPAYAACKDYLMEHNNHGGYFGSRLINLFLAGTLAGIPAALITTPADVIKTRLQSIARPGETAYAGIRDCTTQIYENEGLSAFFRGSNARLLRVAPQFGISLLAYEELTQWLDFPDSLTRHPHLRNKPLAT